MPKISLIGAGSVVFAKNLLSDILQFPALQDATISLMDIDPSRLKVAKVMTEKLIAKLKVPAKVEATLDRTESIRGASYVICTIQVGGYKPATVIDFEIPKKYGLRQTIADTLGVGGVFRALRTIPELVKIGQDIAEVGAKDCLFLNYTNPMAMNCWAIDRATGVPHVGLCHSVQGTSRQLAGYCQVPYEEVRYLAAGINHMAFFLRFDYRGQDLYPVLFRALEDPVIFRQNKVRFEMMRRLGYFVTESSEHQAEYVPHFIPRGMDVIDHFSVPLDEYIRRCEVNNATWHTTERQLLGEGKDIHIDPQTFEYGAYIVNARETNKPIVVYGNVPNRGLIDNLPQGCCVEVPCLVDGMGIQPTKIGHLPPQLAAICRSNINVQELTVEAALTGKREHIYHAVMMDPNTAATLTLDKIWAMCDDLIEAHQKEGYLPAFAPAYPNSGRAAAGMADRVIARLRTDKSISKDGQRTHDLVLDVLNPLSQKVRVKFTLQADHPALQFTQQELEVDVPPGESEHPVQARHADPLPKPVQVRVSSSHPQVTALGMTLRPQPQIVVKPGEAAPFELKLDGVPAVKGTLRLTPEFLEITAEVADSQVTPADQKTKKVTGWTGSWLYFHLAADSRVYKPIQVVITPTPDKRPRLLAGYNYVSEEAPGSVTQTQVGPSYRVEAKIRSEFIGLSPDADELLFNVRASLVALGDAHSGGLAELHPENQFSQILVRA